MKKLLLLITVTILIFSSCKKFLDKKSDRSYAIPETLQDLQALLDHEQFLNSVDGSAAEISNADFYLTDADLAARQVEERNMYEWKRSAIFTSSNEWLVNYRAVYRANSILSYLEKIKSNAQNSQQWGFIYSQAYFLRAKFNLKGLFVFAPAYDENTAGTDLGIPLKEGTDFNAPSVRATVAEGYAQVISDLKNAVKYLPDNNAAYLTRPSKPAAYAMLARAYLSMRKYSEALLYADSCLKIKSDLLDFNSLRVSDPYPIPALNTEVLHESSCGASILNIARAKIAPDLLGLYENNDLRKTLFYKDNNNGTFGFRGSYEGSSALFSGVAIDEVFLIRAECYARANKLPEALNDLNALLRKRYITNTYTDKASNDQQVVINMILAERRKELLMRAISWTDVKRLNKEGAGITYTRTVNGETFTILPNSNGFVLPIPDDVIAITGMPQNP